MAQRVDRVSAFGATLALAGCFLLPFVEFRENRIVSGEPLGIGVADTLGVLLVVTCLVALSASFMRVRSRRGIMLLSSGAAMLAVLPWALGYAAVVLQDGAASPARVSISGGAWLVFAGAVIVWFEASKQIDSVPARVVAGLVVAGSMVASVAFGGVAELSLAKEYVVQGERFWQLVGQHITLSGAGLGFGILIGIPLGVAASRNRVVRTVTLNVVSIIQTVPSLALLGLLVIPLSVIGLPGIGVVPATIALTLYALLPIVRNTYIGLASVDAGALDAGRGMGMGRTQLLFRVEAPLALPLVLEGVRAAAVLVIGIAAVTAFVGAGGLGVLVFLGWGQQADDLTMLGAIPMVVLAVLADAGIRGLSRVTVSPGIRSEAA